MKKLIILAIGMTTSAVIEAQESSKVETTVKADFVNEYIWRGQKLGDVSVQPTLGIGYKGLSVTAWGNYGLSNSDDVKEFDISASYNIGRWTVGVTDYWMSEGQDPKRRYFKYDAHGTNHVFEACIDYDLGFASVQWDTNFAGNDGVNHNGKRAYSSYFEASVPFSIAGVSFTATAGIVPWSTTYYDTDGFAVNDLTLRAEKEIKVTDTFSIPIFGQVTGNPHSQKAYLVFGFTLQPWASGE